VGATQIETTSTARSPDRGVARRQAFLQGARQVFLEQGYESASVNDVVRVAGGSLATLYAQFGNKEGLFLAVVQDQHERVMAAMTPECVDHLPLEKGLQAIGEQFVRAVLARESLAFFRLVVGEGRKFPESAQRYIFMGADKVREIVANYLRVAAPDYKGDVDVLASYFLELLRSRHHYRALADDSYALSDAQLTEHVSQAVRFLLNGMHEP
jgi:AcrR family transcriptional regulator